LVIMSQRFVPVSMSAIEAKNSVCLSEVREGVCPVRFLQSRSSCYFHF
jgi:hypothetical protein